MTANQTALIETQYYGPVQTYTKLWQYDTVYIERCEHYNKRSYRNRCYIAAPEGPQRLSIPLRKGKNRQKDITKVEIDYSYDWQHIHWQAIGSAYRNSAYFELYEDYFEPFYKQRYQYLFEWNRQLTELVVDLLNIEVDIKLTNKFHHKAPDGVDDYRDKIRPLAHHQTPDPTFNPVRYPQVFEERTGFLPNLSIIDLLFNEGPNAPRILEQSIENPVSS